MEVDGGNSVGVSDCATGVRGDQQVIGGVTVQVSKAGRGRWSQAVVLSRQAPLLPPASSSGCQEALGPSCAAGG